MIHEQYRSCPRITIHPGEYYATSETAVISTLLGSCVAACLYDPKLKIIGMNHFMLSNSRYSMEVPIYATEAGRYGIHAMELLINAMMSKGTKRSSLRAKVFGGATMMKSEPQNDNFTNVGTVNCQFIRDYLATEAIPIVAEDLGGLYGRVIHFSNGDFAVHRRKIDSRRSVNVAQRDRECWQNLITRQMETKPNVDLWSV